MQDLPPTAFLLGFYRQIVTVRWLRLPLVLSLALTGSWLAGVAQEGPALTTRNAVHRSERRETITPSLRMDVNRVFIPVMVTDSYGRKVEGLQKDNFRIFRDGVQQTLTEFFVDDSPASIGIVLDASNSMGDKINPSKQAIGAFLRLSLPRDEFCLITVQDHPDLVQAFTTNVDAVERELAEIKPLGWTALYDGMYLGVNHVRRRGDNRALVVLSDGGDNNSRYTESEIKSMVRESDVRVFSVSILGRSPTLEKIAQESGGVALHAHKLSELPEVAASLSELIHGQYVVGFSPAVEARDGKYHSIKVELDQPAGVTGRHVSWRHGYYSPVQ